MVPDAPTPLSVGVLQQILGEKEWTQNHLADASKLHRSVVSMHLAGQRAIRDEHLSNYLRPLDRTWRRALIAAWMRDVLGRDVIGDVVDPASGHVRPEIIQWSPALAESDRKLLTWLANELAGDPELADVMRGICRRLGWPGA